MRKRDFFFGEVYEGSGGATLRLSDMEPLARKVSAEFFTAQLNRILKEHDGQLTLSDGTSYPRFWSFIDKVDPEQVSFSEGDCTSSLGWPPCVHRTSDRERSEVLCTKRRERSELLRTLVHGATKPEPPKIPAINRQAA